MTTITNPPPDQHIDSTRLSADFQALARIGIDRDGYCNRPVFSPAHIEARSWFREQALISGFGFRVDSAGNHSAYLNCGPTGAPSVLISSHLDSVPRGSVYESSTGIPSAMETLRAIKASRASCKFNLEAIDLTDKHGALIGQMGSRTLAGTLTLEDLQHPRGGRGRLLEELTKADLYEAGLILAVRDPRTLIGNIELQIDLSGQLRSTDASIGIVTDIAGIVSYRILFIENRGRDWTGSSPSFPTSSQGASSFVLSTRQLVLDHFPGCTANTGMIEFHPGEIPGDLPDHVAVSLEFRALNTDTLNRLETALIDLAHKEARKYGAEAKLELLEKLHPATTSPWIQNAIARSAGLLGLRSISIQSMAGQNAQTLSSVCPTGVILVSPPLKPEDVHQIAGAWQDLVDGADVLLNTVFHLSQSSG